MGMQVEPVMHAAAHSVSGVCMGVSHAVVGSCGSIAGYTGAQMSRLGSTGARFLRWLQRPDVTERLETYLGLAIVLLTSYASLRLLR